MRRISECQHKILLGLALIPSISFNGLASVRNKAVFPIPDGGFERPGDSGGSFGLLGRAGETVSLNTLKIKID